MITAKSAPAGLTPREQCSTQPMGIRLQQKNNNEPEYTDLEDAETSLQVYPTIPPKHKLLQNCTMAVF